jgi:hypothetical protein
MFKLKRNSLILSIGMGDIFKFELSVFPLLIINIGISVELFSSFLITVTLPLVSKIAYLTSVNEKLFAFLSASITSSVSKLFFLSS